MRKIDEAVEIRYFNELDTSGRKVMFARITEDGVIGRTVKGQIAAMVKKDEPNCVYLLGKLPFGRYAPAVGIEIDHKPVLISETRCGLGFVDITYTDSTTERFHTRSINVV